MDRFSAGAERLVWNAFPAKFLSFLFANSCSDEFEAIDMALPEALHGNSWTAVTARKMFPLLVWCAQHGKKITYGQLDFELQRRKWGHHVNVVVYGHQAGVMGNACIEIEKVGGEKVPPLNALLVNARTGIPGTGCDYYLAAYLDHASSKQFSEDQRRAMAEETMLEVWRFSKWDEILDYCGFKPIKNSIHLFALKQDRGPLVKVVGRMNLKAQNIRHSNSGLQIILRF